jgi:hypothetical protein
MVTNNKKALIFSLATILIVTSIFSFSYTYFTATTEINKISTDSFYGDQMRYFEDDIMQGLELDLMNATIRKIIRDSLVVKLDFIQALDSNDDDNEQFFLDYKNYIEQNYSNNNYNFSLREFTSSFNVTPHSIMYKMVDGRLLIYTANTSNLINISVKVYTDQVLADGKTTNPDDDGGDASFIPIEIYVYGGNGTTDTLVSSMTTREQNPTENNDPFQQTWKDTPNQDVTEVDVEYGTYSGIPGVLQVYLHNANTDYHIAGNASVILYYNTISEVEIIGGILDMSSGIGNLKKSSRHIIKRE